MSVEDEVGEKNDVPTARRGTRRTANGDERPSESSVDTDSGGGIFESTESLIGQAMVEGPQPKLRPSNRYRSFAVIGRGGMGEVQAAHDRRIGRSVALKVLLDEAAERADGPRRFVREARVQGQLEHPSIVPVYDLGADRSGRPYFAMKRVTGVTLSDVIRDLRSGEKEIVARYSLRKLLSIFQSVCLAIDYAHSRGVVHRDVKPSNLMLGDFGEVYVLDWGIAKVRGALEADAGASSRRRQREFDGTGFDEVLGSLGYMAPEQITRPATVDARADVYSLGAVLFELLTLVPLHVRGSDAEIAASTANGADARASVRAPKRELPPELDAICARATAVDPDDRFKSARALHDAIEGFLEGDRDMRLRTELAAQHVDRARRALDLMRHGGDQETRARKRALREAGRALALDPRSEDAAAILARVMLEPPTEMPAEARAITERTRQLEMRNAVRLSSAGLAVTGPIALVTLAFAQVRSYASIGVIAGSLILATLHAYVLGRSKRLDFKLHSVFIGLEFSIAIAGFTRVLGPYFVAPVIALGLAALVAISDWLGRSRIVVIAISWLAWVVPALLEALGYLQPSFRFTDGTVTLLPNIIALPEVPFHVGLLLVNSVAAFVVSAVLWRYASIVAANRQEQDLRTWHLETMASHDDHAHGSLPPPAP